MRYRSAACVLCVSLRAVSASAQAPAPAPQAGSQLVPPPSWAYNDLACAPELVPETKGEPTLPDIRILGSQDTNRRDLLGPGDTLVVSGGSSVGLETGQRYFVRRRVIVRGAIRPIPPTAHTVAWVQIQGVDHTVATATVLHACDGIMLDDYLVPFTPPMIAASPLPGATPGIENMGHVMTGSEGIHTAGIGQTMTIDRGSSAGVVVGQRFLVFRDKRDQRVEVAAPSKLFAASSGQTPIVEVGEVLVVAVRSSDSTVQIVASRDAVITGDLIAPLR